MAWLASCALPADATMTGERTMLVSTPTLGVSFEAPADWRTTESKHALVLAAPSDSAAAFATLTLQASEPSPDCAATDPSEVFATSLLAAYQGTGTIEHLAWRWQWPDEVASWPALHYLVTFDLTEQPRWREGLLWCSNGALVSLHYTAPAGVFGRGLSTFLHAHATLAGVPADGAPPP